VESEGGVQRIESLLNEVQRLSRSNSKILYDVSRPLSLLRSVHGVSTAHDGDGLCARC